MMYTSSHFPGSTLEHQKEIYHYFGGTAYLGLQTDPDFLELHAQHIREFGSCFGASRWANVQLDVYEKAEKFLAEWLKTEDTLSTSSGFLAGQLLQHYFQGSSHPVFYAPNAHPALRDIHGVPCSSYVELSSKLEKQLFQNPNTPPVVFMDAITFSGADYPYYPELKTLPLDRIILVVDDSHGLGVLGQNGEGAIAILRKLGALELILCGSLAKGLGIQAGVIAGQRNRMEALRKLPFFGGASPSGPANMATLLAAQDIYHKKRKRLQEHIQYLHASLNKLQVFKATQNHPTLAYTNPELTEHLRAHKILVTNFAYPNPSKSNGDRVVLSAHHSKQDIEKLSCTINSFGR